MWDSVNQCCRRDPTCNGLGWLNIVGLHNVVDTLPHQCLHKKLHHYIIEFKGISIIGYLENTTGCHQRSQINILYSCCSGVPLGTVCGPTMFLLYINDITANIFSGIRLFADESFNLNKIIIFYNTEDLNHIIHWTKQWQYW